ncbi:MAG TPA: toll/interleukin-1 receptor domain-containing protein [Alloacidobacterium sp.]|nr:toll/interleukin-1 receptor domain-containing protein [Alloacidobacterium sp.]
MAHAIFISYRRDDSEGEAGRLFDDLTRAFGNDAVFMDVVGIDPGIDFRKAIDNNVAGCGVLLAMIGPTWATITGSDGQRRLDNPNDYVRLEIASALTRNIAVIPVLVHDAHMPHADQLPDNLKDLAYRNSVEITHARWNSDVQLLIQALTQYVHSTKATEADTVHATIPVQLPPPHAAAEAAPVRAKSKTPFIAGLAALGVVVIALIVFFALRGPTSSTSPLDGRWTNPSADGRDAVAELDITGGGQQLAIHAWGLCKPANCDWGTQNATFDGQKAKATWSLLSDASGEEKGRVATLTISAGSTGKLEVAVENTYPKHPGNTHQFEFVRAQ